MLVPDVISQRLLQGQSVLLSAAREPGLVRLMTQMERFIGVGEVVAGGKVIPRRMVQGA